MKFDRRYENFLLLLFCFLTVAIWALPIWYTPGMAGIGDWDWSMHRYEVLRLTVAEFGQWPGHNPWNIGGIPFLGNPSISILSIRGLLVLVFGTYWGLRLGVLIYVFICFIGSWKLSGIWWKSRFIRLVFSFYITASPALAYHCAVGHLLFQTFCFMPLLFYFLFKFNQDRWSGLKAAIVFGIAFNASPAYIVQYSVLILICLYIYLFVSKYKENSRMLLRWLALFVPICAALTFYRIMTILPVAFDFPRITNFRMHFDWVDLLKLYFIPYIKFGPIFPPAKYSSLAYTHEICSYVGIVGFILFLLSFRRGFRWWHAMALLLVWAGMGNDSYFHIMYWIQKIPSFSSHGCFTRIRVFTLLFFGIAATWGLNHLWIKYKNNNSWIKYKNHNITTFRYFVICIGVLMVLEVLLVSHIIMKSSHVKIAPWASDNPSNKFQNISSLPWPEGTPSNIRNNLSMVHRAIRMNLGWLRGFGDPYLPGNTARIGLDEPGYIGEFHQNGKSIEPEYWSPNKILFKRLEPGVPLTVNMNPGSPWYCNDKQLFPEYRIVELMKPFEVMPNEDGVVELTYIHPGQRVGIIGTIILLIISAFVVVRLKRSY